MKSRLGLAVMVVALAASALVTLPSGAGQHFGIIGDTLAWGLESTAQARSSAGFPQVEARGVLIWGPGAVVDDAIGTLEPIFFAGCIQVDTMRGHDEGCETRPVELPPVIFDPLMQRAQVAVTIRSDVFPGAMIHAQLLFLGSDPTAMVVSAGGGSCTNVPFLVVGRAAEVSGTIQSSAVGVEQVGTQGIIGKGALAQSCD